MNKQRYIPHIRFVGFECTWQRLKLDEISERITKKNNELQSTLPLTISAQHGLVDQITYFNKRIASKNITNYYLLEKGDFAYNKSYSKDYPWGVVKRLDKYNKGVLSTLYIVFKPTRVNSDFLLTYYDTNNWHKEVSMRAAEGARNHGLLNITALDFFDTDLFIPVEKEEQKQIGTFFKQLEETITLQQQLLNDHKQLKKAMLQKMFPQKGESVPKIRFVEFTDKWKHIKLGEVCERVKGNDGRMDLPTLTISAGRGWLDQRERFSANIAGNEQKNYTLLSRGELSYNHGNSKLAKYGVIFELRSYTEALVPRVYHSFRTTKNSNSSFIEYMFETKQPDRELAKLVSSGARMDGLLNISYDAFMGIKIKMPTFVEQKKIGNFFEKLDETIALYEKKLKTYQELKKAMLQKMFV